MKYLTPDWPAPLHVKAYTSLRQGWQSTALPLQDSEEAIQSAHTLTTLFALPRDPLWVTQKHTAIALEATAENKGRIADATYTRQKNHICAILTADCLPILICDTAGTRVAAIHAGWRGLASGIIEATLQHLMQPGEPLLAWLGPAIGPQKFEVGLDVYEAFTQKHPESATAFTLHTTGKWMADLYALARMRLKEQGITQIYGGHYCTYTQDDLFFSYRRDKGRAGSMASLIWIADN